MLSRLRDFVSRHRRKFIVTGVVVGGTYFALRFAQNKLIEFQERKARELIDKTRRLQHFQSTEQTCNEVIVGMGTELLQVIIERECSTAELLEQLRQNPANKVDLWEEIKIVAFTRLASFIYASSMLVIALRIQMNLLAGYVYTDITTEQKQISNEVKQMYLSLIANFIHGGGLHDLISYIRSKVTALLKDVPLDKLLGLADIEQLFWSIQMAINSDVDADPTVKLAKYLLPPKLTVEMATASFAPLLEKMFNETLDLLESEDAHTICSNNVCRGFSLAVDAIAECFDESVQISKQRDAATDENIVNINTVRMAHAKIIPIISVLTSKGFDATTRPQNLPTALLTFHLQCEKCRTLGTNVYETFSSS